MNEKLYSIAAQLPTDELARDRGVFFGSMLGATLMLHFFNHQTHHRGQATILLSQQGLDIGVTDLLALIPSG